MFEGFNVGEKRENNESPSDCSPKKKQATIVTKKTSKHMEKSEDNVSYQEGFDEISFEESQSVELQKNVLKEMEEFRKNVENQQSLMFEQRDLKEIEKVMFSSGFIYSIFYGHLTILLLN